MISDWYLREQQVLHSKGYGEKGDKWAFAVASLARRYECSSILDYGCGAGSLMRQLRTTEIGRLKLREYDPAIPGKDEMPKRSDLVVSTDVLEHIEPDLLPNVINHLFGLANKVVMLVIATRPANKKLSDGSNAHLIIESGKWWAGILDDRLGWERIGGVTAIGRTKPAREWTGVYVRDDL